MRVAMVLVMVANIVLSFAIAVARLANVLP